MTIDLTPPADCIVHADPWSNGRCSLMPMTDSSPVSDLLALMGCERDASVGEPGFSVPIWQVRSGAALLLEGARSSHVYVIRTGTFKCIKTAEDGYEQVLSFAGQGDVLAFEAMGSEAQHMGAIALEDSSVYALPVRKLDTWRRLSPRFDHALQLALSRQLTRAGEITELMAAVSSDVRLARFIAWWSNRMAQRGQSPRRLLLRMSRRDIASLLGVAHETVSRSFSSFVDRGLLRVDNREIEIIDPVGLKACTRNTRGLCDDTPHRTATARARERAAAVAVAH
jgi:CRP/FNR family transcriptional regulator